jgi:threonine dehydratase
MPDTLTCDLIEEAGRCLEGRIRRTPVEPSPVLSRLLGVPVWLKLESLQVTGSFKIRGAYFALSRLDAAQKERGIATCSAGNHGKAVAYAARDLGVKAVIYVPNSVDEAKYQGMLALGAAVKVSQFAGFDDTEQWAMEEAARAGLPYFSAYDDFEIIAANGGTLAQEVLDQVPEARAFLLPVGGGGLAAGFSYVAKQRDAECRIIGCQHELSPGLQLSLQMGAAVTRLPAIDTLAGGVEGGLGARPFSVLQSRVDRVALVTEEEIIEGVRWMLEAHQYLIEPSSAVTVAAALQVKTGPLTAPAVVVVGGRNVALSALRWILRE